jgi:hypothetical protein
MAKAPAKMNRKELLIIILVVLFMLTSLSVVRRAKMSAFLPLLVIERSEGIIGWQIPQKMKQGVDEKATVRIAGTLAEDLSKQYFEKLGKSKNIEVFPKMTVHLKSGSAFKIKPLTEDDQIVLKDKVTEWRYLIHQ